MWPLGILFMLSFTSVILCLDSNEIRSSREVVADSQQTVTPLVQEVVDLNIHNTVRRRRLRPECTQERGNKCRGSKKNQRHHSNTTAIVQEKVHECLKSRDCGEGRCCAQEPSGKRCKPLLNEGDVCTLIERPKTKSRRHLERCPCSRGLQCRMQFESNKGLGKCLA